MADEMYSIPELIAFYENLKVVSQLCLDVPDAKAADAIKKCDDVLTYLRSLKNDGDVKTTLSHNMLGVHGYFTKPIRELFDSLHE